VPMPGNTCSPGGTGIEGSGPRSRRPELPVGPSAPQRRAAGGGRPPACSQPRAEARCKGSPCHCRDRRRSRLCRGHRVRFEPQPSLRQCPVSGQSTGSLGMPQRFLWTPGSHTPDPRGSPGEPRHSSAQRGRSDGERHSERQVRTGLVGQTGEARQALRAPLRRNHLGIKPLPHRSNRDTHRDSTSRNQGTTRRARESEKHSPHSVLRAHTPPGVALGAEGRRFESCLPDSEHRSPRRESGGGFVVESWGAEHAGRACGARKPACGLKGQDSKGGAGASAASLRATRPQAGTVRSPDLTGTAHRPEAGRRNPGPEEGRPLGGPTEWRILSPRLA